MMAMKRHPQPFEHGCCVCAHPVAPYGVGYDPANGKLGRFYCAKHLPEEHQPPRERANEVHRQR